jgi:raffinose/stachyose/melibiose transport system permease protein
MASTTQPAPPATTAGRAIPYVKPRRVSPATQVLSAGWTGVRYALLAVYVVLCLYPFLWMLSASLRTSAGVFAAGLSLWVDDPQWINYVEIWQEASIPRAAFITICITAVCMAVIILTTSMTAFAVTRSDFPGRRVVMVALLTTFLIPGEMLIIPTFYVNRALHLIGDWRSVIAVILVMTAGAQVFNIYLLIGHFQTLPSELFDAAAVDGETYFGMYRRIAFPLVTPAIATIALLTFMAIWNAYIIPLVYLAPLRDFQTLTIALIQYSKQFQTLYHIMAAGAVIILIPIIVVFIFLQRYFIRGLTEGATKG